MKLIGRRSSRIAAAGYNLEELFGTPVATLARAADTTNLKLAPILMDQVYNGADALLQMSGNLAEQHRYIDKLSSDVRLVLCMWLSSPRMALAIMLATTPGVAATLCPSPA